MNFAAWASPPRRMTGSIIGRKFLEKVVSGQWLVGSEELAPALLELAVRAAIG
jgi:hypothetical protein